MARQGILFRIPIIGWGMKGGGYIPVERSSRTKSARSLIVAAKIVQSGARVVIFPEGTRSNSKNEELLPFKKKCL